jgi:hypothetical protein
MLLFRLVRIQALCLVLQVLGHSVRQGTPNSWENHNFEAGEGGMPHMMASGVLLDD